MSLLITGGMKKSKRRNRNREQMRRRILDAAKLLFVKEGYDNVSMRRIGAAIEYSPAAIYRYFNNKREILSVLRNEGFRQFIAGQKERMRTYSDPVQRLREGGRGYIRFAMEEPDYYHLMFSTDTDEVDLEGEWAESSLASFKLFRQMVQECLDTGCFGAVDLEPAVFAFWSGVHGLAELIHTGRFGILSEGPDSDKLIDSILDFNLRLTVRQDYSEA